MFDYVDHICDHLQALLSADSTVEFDSSTDAFVVDAYQLWPRGVQKAFESDRAPEEVALMLRDLLRQIDPLHYSEPR